MDDLIRHYNEGEALKGRVDVDNAKRTTFIWRLEDTTSTTRQPIDVLYRMTVQKGSGSVNLTAQALGYIGPFTARGKCAERNS